MREARYEVEAGRLVAPVERPEGALCPRARVLVTVCDDAADPLYAYEPFDPRRLYVRVLVWEAPDPARPEALGRKYGAEDRVSREFLDLVVGDPLAYLAGGVVAMFKAAGGRC